MRRAVDDHPFDGRRLWLMALGKAAGPMAAGAVESLAARGIEPAGGLIVAPAPGEPPHAAVAWAVGDHPTPGAGSAAAADRVGELAARVGADDDVLVLLSGGATSLVAAPVDAITREQLARVFDVVLGAGIDIAAMNTVRKRFARWGAGRLAAALAPARVHCLVVSDVVGDDLASIGSGPCVPDPLHAADVLALVDREVLAPRLPPAALQYLEAVAAGAADETPKPDDPAFERTATRIVLANADARDAAAARARALGVAPVKVVATPLDDDAAFTGARLAEELIRFHEGGLVMPDASGPYGCMIWGGETTVVLGEGAHGRGGRCQELALAAACALGEAGPRGEGITLLAAGTDGRDGPTDAAGAIVDHATCAAAHGAGHDAARDLADHDAYAALEAADALVRVGLTGTNVQDIVIGLVERGA